MFRDPVRTSASLDPFPKMPFNTKDFPESSVDQKDGDYVVTLKGGRAKDAGIDRIEVLFDSKDQLIRTMIGYDSAGNVLLDGSITYDLNSNLMKKMSLVIGNSIQKSTVTSEILLNEPNKSLDDKLFSVVIR